MPVKKAAAVSKPTYAVMVAESIKALNDRTGSSVQAIVKQLQASYKFDVNKPALVKAIKKGVEAGDLVQIKASYKINKKAASSKAKKPVAPPKKKSATIKPSTTKKSTTTSKRSLKPKKAITKRSSTTKKSSSTKKSSTKITRRTAPKKATTTKKKTKK